MSRRVGGERAAANGVPHTRAPLLRTALVRDSRGVGRCARHKHTGMRRACARIPLLMSCGAGGSPGTIDVSSVRCLRADGCVEGVESALRGGMTPREEMRGCALTRARPSADAREMRRASDAFLLKGVFDGPRAAAARASVHIY